MGTDPREGLIRGARELLRWDQGMLAEAAQVHSSTVRRVEFGVAVDPVSVEKLIVALQKGGIIFLPRGTIGGESIEGGLALKTGARMLPRPEKKKAEGGDGRLLKNGGGSKIKGVPRAEQASARVPPKKAAAKSP